MDNLISQSLKPLDSLIIKRSGKFKEGQIYKDASGAKAIFKNGEFEPIGE